MGRDYVTMRDFPETTENPNVPPDAVLIAEMDDDAGWFTTYYVAREDRLMWMVSSRAGDQPQPLYWSRLCRDTLLTVQMIEPRAMARLERAP